MPGVTLTGLYSSTYTLTNPAAQNPLTLASGGRIDAGTATGLLGEAGAAWTIDIQGSITTTGSTAAGVNLQAGGSIANETGALISGALDGIYATGAATGVTNTGSIAGATAAGIELEAGGAVDNQLGGIITGVSVGVDISFGGTVTNLGTIGVAGGNTAGGVVLRNGGTVDNAATGSIAATGFGIYLIGTSGAVTNDGSIAGNGESGVGFSIVSGATLTNHATGRITGHYSGAFVTGGPGTVVNDGYIGSPTGNGLNLGGGGVVGIGSTGTISGYATGVVLGDIGTITNAGQITGTSNDGVRMGAGGGVTNTGGIAGYAGVYASIAAVSVTNQGSITGLGGFGVRLRAGGSIDNQASGMIATGNVGVSIQYGAGTVANAGTIAAGNPLADAVQLAAGYANLVKIDPGASFGGIVDGGDALGGAASSTLELAAGGAGTLSGIGTRYIDFTDIAFDPGAQWSIAGSPAGLGGAIGGFAPGDTIELTGLAATGHGFAGTTLTLATSGGPVTLDLTGGISAGAIRVANVAGGVDITLAAPCFAAGTRILTERGPVAVEMLRAGDVAITATADGVGRSEIVWLGHRRVECRRHPAPHDVQPVRIAPGAFGPGQPHRELLLSPDHAVFFADALIPVRYLVNGASIAQLDVERVQYWHVELQAHGVLLAEGLPCESYLDTGNRSAFANGGGAAMAQPDFALRVWEAQACAPLLADGPALTEARRTLLARAAALGHAATEDADLFLLADGQRIAPAMTGSVCRFTLPPGVTDVRLQSRHTVPAWMDPASHDRRRLGIAIGSLSLDGQPVALDDPRFGSGWHAPEPHWRWSDGDAGLTVSGAAVLEVAVAMSGRYWETRPADQAPSIHGVRGRPAPAGASASGRQPPRLTS